MARILSVDDDPQVRSLIEDILDGVGHEVVCVDNPTSAMDVLEKGRFDLALLDVMMPKGDGYHLATHISGLPNPPAMVFVSARDFNEDEKVLESLGAAAFIRKPFTRRELLRVVNTVLEKGKDD